jgi:hypothetical protein
MGGQVMEWMSEWMNGVINSYYAESVLKQMLPRR